ncbi:unnamed protein product [Urochloa humidicola]
MEVDAPMEEVCRERTRSPCTRDTSTLASEKHFVQANALPRVEDMRNKMVEDLHDLFTTRASALQKEMINYINANILG